MTEVRGGATAGGPATASSQPNLFLVGAPKSGTTALGTYLGSHPDVFVAPAELSYFGSDLDFRTRAGAPWRIPWDRYLEWFAGHEDVRYRADRSVFYLYSRRAAKEIHDYDPSSRIVAMVRNPVDQMYSEHSEMRYLGGEDLADFAEALGAEADRKAGRRIPEGCQHAFGLFYRDIVRYAEQLERYLALFGTDQVHVVVYDDLAADAAGTYRTVLEFLGVDATHEPELAVVNANKAVRSPALHRVLGRASPAVRRAGRLLVPGAARRAQLRRRLDALNTVQRPRPPLDPGLRAELAAELEPEVRRLEALLGRELPSWRPGEAGGRR